MNEASLSQDMSVYDLACLMVKGFERVDVRFDALEDRFDQLEYRHNARLERLEDDSRIVKTILEIP